ncbi:hypothetical protein ANDA3_1938 [plant metagenome]|uniref:Uncharacterized protein n=2 Tax=root TaxID=1 RepID=A0A1C3K8N7_9BURK|nr:hypothetical protein ODI_02172 [Orrella dioscoreae]SOE49195.1 hypothetical protein ODI_R1906 [Orrella dioscoreae]
MDGFGQCGQAATPPMAASGRKNWGQFNLPFIPDGEAARAFVPRS